MVPLPNTTNVFYGRDVGYSVECIMLDEASEAISADQIVGRESREEGITDNPNWESQTAGRSAGHQCYRSVDEKLLPGAKLLDYAQVAMIQIKRLVG